MVPGTLRGVQQVVHSYEHEGFTEDCARATHGFGTIKGPSSSATIEQLAAQVSCPENGGIKCRSCTLPSCHDRVCSARGRSVKSCKGAWRFERCLEGGAVVSMKSLPRMALVQPRVWHDRGQWPLKCHYSTPGLLSKQVHLRMLAPSSKLIQMTIVPCVGLARSRVSPRSLSNPKARCSA